MNGSNESDNEDQVAVITGAARGIGKTITGILAERNINTILLDIHSADNTVADIRDQGGRAESHIVDLTDEIQVNRIFKRIERRYGGLDFLVNRIG